MSWERARQPEQIEQRRREILGAAASLFAEKGLDGASLSAIARAAGVSKANIYRYFESREAIFLELLTDDLQEWVAALEAALAPLAGSGDREGFVEAFVQTVLERDRLMALVSSLSSVLEQNISKDAVRAFKRGFMAASFRVVNAAHAALPALELADAGRFFRFFTGYGMGIYASAHPPPHVSEVMAEPEFEPLRGEFESMLREHAHILLAGLVGLSAN